MLFPLSCASYSIFVRVNNSPRRRRSLDAVAADVRRVSKRRRLTPGARRGCRRGQDFVYRETLFRHRDSGTDGGGDCDRV